MNLKAIFTFVGLMVLVALIALISVASAGAGSSWRHLIAATTEDGSGARETEKREVGTFTRIEFSAAADLNITIGTPQKVAVTIDDNLLDNIRTRVHGGALEISSRSSYSSDKGCQIDVQVERLDAIELHGSGDIHLMNMDGDKFDLDLSGSGNFIAEGKVRALEISLDGSGNIDTRKLDADTVSVEINGSGDARVRAISSFKGDVNGSGDIEYTGEPEHVSRHVGGSGSITHQNRQRI